uniref:Uncharacterized protein n=1 Tax=Timema genevievae TaxID=629358 RepID=A0A7R9K890_TIMGE|nr:unnamed protein product [Timema genevievae]
MRRISQVPLLGRRSTHVMSLKDLQGRARNDVLRRGREIESSSNRQTHDISQVWRCTVAPKDTEHQLGMEVYNSFQRHGTTPTVRYGGVQYLTKTRSNSQVWRCTVASKDTGQHKQSVASKDTGQHQQSGMEVYSSAQRHGTTQSGMEVYSSTQRHEITQPVRFDARAAKAISGDEFYETKFNQVGSLSIRTDHVLTSLALCPMSSGVIPATAPGSEAGSALATGILETGRHLLSRVHKCVIRPRLINVRYDSRKRGKYIRFRKCSAAHSDEKVGRYSLGASRIYDQRPDWFPWFAMWPVTSRRLRLATRVRVQRLYIAAATILLREQCVRKSINRASVSLSSNLSNSSGICKIGFIILPRVINSWCGSDRRDRIRPEIACKTSELAGVDGLYEKTRTTKAVEARGGLGGHQEMSQRVGLISRMPQLL